MARAGRRYNVSQTSLLRRALGSNDIILGVAEEVDTGLQMTTPVSNTQRGTVLVSHVASHRGAGGMVSGGGSLNYDILTNIPIAIETDTVPGPLVIITPGSDKGTIPVNATVNAHRRASNLHRRIPNSPFVMSPNATDAAAWMGYGAETDTALPLTVGVASFQLGIAVETDTGTVNTVDGLALAGGYATTPDSVTWNINGQLRMVIRLSMVDWTPPINSVVMAHSIVTGNQRSFVGQVDSSGAQRIQVTSDGVTYQVDQTHAPAPALVNGTTYWLGYEYNSLTGAWGIYRHADTGTNTPPTIWSGWSEATTGVATAVIPFDSTAPLSIGARGDGNAPLSGTIQVARLYDDGVLIADADFTASASPVAVAGAATYTDSVGNVWTLVGAAFIDQTGASVTASEEVTLGQPTEVDTGLPMDNTTGTLLDIATETDTAGQLTPDTKLLVLGIATEVDTAIGFGVINVDLGLATEIDTGLPLSITAPLFRFFGPTDLVVGPIAADPRDSQGPLSQKLFAKYRARARGRNVYILTNGTVTEERPTVIYYDDGRPPLDVEDQIRHTLFGGHIEPITPAEATLLTNAGYAANISIEV